MAYLKSQKHRGWRQQRRKLSRWQIKPGVAVGFVRCLATLKCPLPGNVICHLSSAWSKGCSLEAAMNKNSFPSILMLYLPQKSKSLLKHRQATAAQCRKTWSALQQEQEPAWIFHFKKLFRIQRFEHDKNLGLGRVTLLKHFWNVNILKCLYGYLLTEEIKTNLKILQQAHGRIFRQGPRLAKGSVTDHCLKT